MILLSIKDCTISVNTWTQILIRKTIFLQVFPPYFPYFDLDLKPVQSQIMDGLGKAVVGVWRAHTVLDESDGAESSPEVPDRFRKMRSSSSLGSLRMSLRKRLPLRSVQANSLPETSSSEFQQEQPKPNMARKLSRSARNSISGMCQVNVCITDG